MGEINWYAGLGGKPLHPDADDLSRARLDAKKMEREEKRRLKDYEQKALPPATPAPED